MNKKSTYLKNKIFLNVLSKSQFHSTLGNTTLDFIQLQFSINHTVFPEISSSFYAIFFSKIALHVFQNFICNHSLSLIFTGLHVKFV